MKYRIFLSEEVWRFLDREEIDRVESATLLSRLDEGGDFQELNPFDQRHLSIKILGKYAITYYLDHAVSEIKILDIEEADC